MEKTTRNGRVHQLSLIIISILVLLENYAIVIIISKAEKAHTDPQLCFSFCEVLLCTIFQEVTSEGLLEYLLLHW